MKIKAIGDRQAIFLFLCSFMSVLSELADLKLRRSKLFAVLVDPDDEEQHVRHVTEAALVQGAQLFLVGGSLLTEGETSKTVKLLKGMGVNRVILFPGHEIQVVEEADAILFMSLISGRNPEFLIGKQVNAAPWVKKAGIETIPTGYMLVDGGKMTSAVYMSHTIPLPADKPDIAAATAMAGEMLGHKVFYLDAGSGATKPVRQELISRVESAVDGFLFVGGGITNAENARMAWEAGADCVVIGNGVFENIDILKDIGEMCNKLNTSRIGV